MRRVVTVTARAGSLALSLLAAWCFFHGLTWATQAVAGEVRDGGAALQQLGMDVGD